MSSIPGIKVVHPKGGAMVINQTDFDPKIHKLWSDVASTKPISSPPKGNTTSKKKT